MDRPPHPTRRLLVGVGAAVVLGLATATLAWWRLGPVTRGTVWAEDGGLFLRERMSLGPVDSLLHPYAGYLHLVPRLLVDLGWALPVADYALVLSGAACLVVGVLAAAVFLLAREVVPVVPVRVLLAASPAFLPLAPHEISGNAANLHWFMLFTAPWLFAHRSRTWWASGAVAALTVFVVLTELQSVAFLPLLVLAWVPLRDTSGARAWPRALPVTVVALAAGTAQVVVALTDQRTARPGTPPVADVAAGWLLQPFAGLWDPDVGAVVRAVLDRGWAVVAVPAVLVLLVLVAAVVVGAWRARTVTIALTLGSLGVWWAALTANGGADRGWAHPVAALATVGPLRYAAASGLLLLAAVLVAAGVLVRSAGWSPAVRRRVRPGGAARLTGAVTGWCVVALVVVVAVAGAVPGPTRRSDGPVWAEQIPAAVAACGGDRSRSVDVRTAPWGVDVPCTRLLPAGGSR
ncbi:hypothetical protein ACTJKO_08735 [Curtobacterium sp. 22159]|uniref:hypothetical protein n=1 Tax=Curtobacterium sp. 22159 TaxID=3453882 RepID=UPI003F859B93